MNFVGMWQDGLYGPVKGLKTLKNDRHLSGVRMANSPENRNFLTCVQIMHFREQHVGVLSRNLSQGLGHCGDGHRFKTPLFQAILDNLADIFILIDEKDTVPHISILFELEIKTASQDCKSATKINTGCYEKD